MKRTTTMALALVITATANAQTTSLHEASKALKAINKRHQHIATYFGNKAVAEKTTTGSERLIASSDSWTYFLASTNVYDSANYYYSGTNGSQFDFSMMQYDFPETPFDYDQAMIAMPFHITHPYVYCDSFLGRNYDTTGSLTVANTTTCLYDGSLNLTGYKSVYADTTYNPDIRYLNTYNAMNQPEMNLSYSYSAGAWDSSGLRYFSYNDAGQLVEDSLLANTPSGWVLVSKYNYSYDGSGNCINVRSYSWNDTASSWHLDEHDTLAYNADNTIKTIMTYADTGSGIMPYYIDSFGYQAGISYFTLMKEWTYTDTGRSLAYTSTKYIDADTYLPDSVKYDYIVSFYDTSGTFLGTEEIILLDRSIDYDFSHNPTKIVQYISDGSSYYLNATQKYYYSTTTSGVQNVAENGDIHIYPNPARDVVTLSLGGADPHATIMLNLMNVNGQVVHSESIPWQNASEQISMAGLTPGIYMLTAQDANGRKWKTQSIVKQ